MTKKQKDVDTVRMPKDVRALVIAAEKFARDVDALKAQSKKLEQLTRRAKSMLAYDRAAHKEAVMFMRGFVCLLDTLHETAGEIVLTIESDEWKEGE